MDYLFEYEDKLTDKWTITEQKSIERSLNTIASTVRGTAPFMRDMGLDTPLPEDNSLSQKNAYITNMLSQLMDWEERVEASEAEFINDNEIKVVVYG